MDIMRANVSDYIAAGNNAARQTSNIQAAAIQSGPDYSKIAKEAQNQKIKTEIEARKAAAGVVKAGMEGEARLKIAENRVKGAQAFDDAKKRSRKAGAVAAAGMLIGEGLRKDPPRIKQEATDYSALEKSISDMKSSAEEAYAKARQAQQNVVTDSTNPTSANDESSIQNVSSTKFTQQSSYGKPQLVQLLKESGFKGDANTFASIGMAESGGAPGIDTVMSGLDPNKRNEYSVGLWQINTKAHMDKLKRRGLTVDDLRDPKINAQLAIEIYNEAGGSFRPWGAYTNKSYEKYL